MSSFTKLISIRRITDNSVYKVSKFRTKNASEKEKLTQLLDSDPGVLVVDELRDQLKELVKIENPSRKLSEGETDELISQHLGETAPEDYGVWVYYPWLRKVVHLLDEEEFVKVRTSRNQYKITAEERETLKSKKIGVIGLSVGQSASVTMAMERTFGEIRIADFDNLELTNLNRIRTGTQNLGLPKVVMVAREIAEIDPFLKVIPYFDGITENNIEQFFTEGGMLDLLVEECDGVDIKILAREVAKKHKVPIVMDMSDRGCLDIERYDLEDDYPLLHGLIPKDADYELLKSLKTNEEKMPYLLPMVQTDNLSARMKASLLEVGQTISTWPQLSSDVVMGGAFATNLARRILLDQLHVSGRYYIDPDELIKDEEASDDENRELSFSNRVYDSLERFSMSDIQNFNEAAIPAAFEEQLHDLALKDISIKTFTDQQTLERIQQLLSRLDLTTLVETRFRNFLLDESQNLSIIQPSLINILRENEMMRHLTSNSEAIQFLVNNNLGRNLQNISNPPQLSQLPLIVLSTNKSSANNEKLVDDTQVISELINELDLNLHGVSLAPLISQNESLSSTAQSEILNEMLSLFDVSSDNKVILIARVISLNVSDQTQTSQTFMSQTNNRTDVQF